MQRKYFNIIKVLIKIQYKKNNLAMHYKKIIEINNKNH